MDQSLDKNSVLMQKYVNYLNTLNKADKLLEVDLVPDHLIQFAPRMWHSRGKLFFWMQHILSLKGTFSPSFRIAFDKIPLVNHLIYGLLYCIIKDKRMNALAYYFRCIMFFYERSLLSAKNLTALTSRLIQLDFHFEYHFDLINITLKEITKRSLRVFPSECFKKVIQCFMKENSSEFYLNKHFLLLLSIDDPSLIELAFSFLIKVFQFNYDITFFTYITKRVIKAPFAFKYNSIAFIKRLIKEEEPIRLDDSFYIKKGFVIEEGNPLIVNGVPFDSREFSMIFAFNYSGVYENEDQAKAVLFALNSSFVKGAQRVYAIEIKDETLIISRGKTVEGEYRIKRNKDYLIVITQRMTANYGVFKRFELSTIIEGNSFTSRSSIDNELKEVSFVFGQNFEGIIGSFHFSKSACDSRMINYIFNLKEDYAFASKARYDLTLLKPLLNRIISNDTAYIEAYSQLKHSPLKMEVDVLPSFVHRFMAHSNYIKLRGKTIVEHEDNKRDLKVRTNRKFTLFQFLKFEGLKYIILLFGLLDKATNDNINDFIAMTLSFLLDLLDYLEAKYFKSEHYLIFAVIINYISSNSKKGAFKVNLTLYTNLLQKMNFFNISDELKLRNCFVMLLLDKSIYELPLVNNNLISLFTSVTSCIKSNSTGLMKKATMTQLLTYSGLIEGNDSTRKPFFKLLVQFNISCVSNGKTKALAPLIEFVTKSQDIKPMKRYKLLKMIYIFLGRDSLVKSNESLCNYIGNQFESADSKDQCKWTNLSLCMNYLILEDNVDLKHELKAAFNQPIDRVCLGYPFILAPTIEFFRCVFVELFFDTNPKTKTSFIKGKASFKDLAFPAGSNKSLEWLKTKFLSLEKYIETIIEKSTPEYYKASGEPIIGFIHDFIKQLLVFLKERLYVDTVKAFFTSQTLTNYMFFLNRKNIGQPDKLLSEIIETTLPFITRPFYFNFLYEFYESNIMIENDMSLIIEKITNYLCNQQTFSNTFLFNQLHYLHVLNQIITLAQNRISTLLDRCVVKFFNYLSNQPVLMSKVLIKNGKETKSCLELVFDTMVLLCKNYKADENHIGLLMAILKKSDHSIFYLIDFNPKPINYCAIGQPADYPFTLFFFVKIMNVRYKERDSKTFFFLNEIALLTFNDILFILSKSKTKKVLKSSSLRDADVKEVLDFFEKKHIDKSFAMFEKLYFNYHDEKGIVKVKGPEKVASKVKLASPEISAISDVNLSRRDSNPFPKWRKHFDLATVDADVDSTSETFALKKRSYSQTFSSKKHSTNVIKLLSQKALVSVNISKNPEFNLYLIEDTDEESVKTLFNLRHEVLLHSFPFIFRDYLFKNKAFIQMRNVYNANYPVKPENNVLRELDYPTKLRNYTCKSFYKPFLKPDLKFFSNPLYRISHPYYNNPGEDALSTIQFDRICPKMKMKSIIFKSHCELITNVGSIFGEMAFNSSYVEFKAKPEEDLRAKKKVSAKTKLKYAFSSDENDVIANANKKVLFYLKEIEEVFSRRCFFQWIGLEFFLMNRKSYFFNFFIEKKKQKCLSALSSLGIEGMSIITDIFPTFKREGFMKEWQNNKLSTFEYLLMINKYSGRSYNDSYQYPVFPWVFADSSVLQRDFSRVICDQSESKREALYNSYKRNNNHFNFHYSNSGHVLYYLSRSNPFTYSLIRFQSYKFDVPSRMFTSISDTLMVFTMLSETRELIPEFFSDYNFLINLNKNDFGLIKEKKLRLNDVICQTKSYVYVSSLRLRLEQSDSIGLWIDMIFGANQLMSVGNMAMNMFAKSTYEKHNNLPKKMVKWAGKGVSYEVILERIRSKISLYAFGSCPYQLFQNIHPRKNPIGEMIYSDYLHENLKNYLKLIKGDKFRVMCSKNLIILKTLSSFEVFTMTKEKKELPRKTVPFPKQGHLRFRKQACCQISPTVFALCRFFDNTIRLLDLNNKDYEFIIQCDSFITSICSIGKELFVTGDENGFIVKWMLITKPGKGSSYRISKRVLGHECEVLMLHYKERLDIILSIDERNICAIHNQHTLDLINIIQVKEKVHDLKVSFQDFIFFLCDCCNFQRRFYIYTLNGLLLSQTVQAREIADFELSVNSSEIIIAQGDVVYKSDIFAIDLMRKRHSTDEELIFSWDDNSIIKEMIFCRELEIILFVFNNNSLAIKNMIKL